MCALAVKVANNARSWMKGNLIPVAASVQHMSAPFTVLFVEDDDGVRASTAAILAEHGVRLFVAKNGFEALDILVQERVDVLFTDIVMPDLDGIELAKRALARQSDLKVMFMTAYYSRAAEAQRLGKLVFKPLRAREIEAELDELLTAAVDGADRADQG